MATIKKVTKSSEVVFCGRGWLNTPRADEGKAKKDQRHFYRVVIDRDGPEVTLRPGDSFELWPNNKREGKNDADLRMSLRIEGGEESK